MTTIRRTRSQVTDEVMVVALSVGACPGGALAALKGLLEQFDETLSKRVFTTKKGSDDPFSATSRRSPTVREWVQKSAVLRYVWTRWQVGTATGDRRTDRFFYTYLK